MREPIYAPPDEQPDGAGPSSRLSVLNTVTWLITSKDLNAETFHRIATELFASLPSRFLGLALANEETGAFDVIYGDAYGREGMARPKHVFDRHGSVYGWVFDHRRPLFLPDIREAPQFPEHAPMAAGGVRARMVVPLLCGESALGVLALSSSTVHAFAPEDAEFLTIIADAIALGLRNRELVERTARLELLERTERMRSLLLSSVSHELRTPLGLIKGYLAVLAQDWDATPSHTQQEFLAIAMDETDRLTALVDSLLDMSCLQSGHLTVHVEPVQPARLIQDALRRLRPLVGARRLEVCLAARLPRVMADPQRIGQVLGNLIENAVRHTPCETAITVSATPREQDVMICVADDGPGIARHDVDRLFTPFARLEGRPASGDGARAGLGLGLAISRGIVEAHRGRIWVESSPGSGARFSFTLPMMEKRHRVPAHRSV